ncbi:unnamed protein product [Adineta ricciae]|uniref:CN hydrolase domain-containing protein n=1 Tax=Adineta ricciae TaxID=249248 RepID=A0A813UEJ2_ADIRI|nr:unnamed protein product [Adineta ricciae]CAF1241092.1 unnamed protein product [Adineta ricciae]
MSSYWWVKDHAEGSLLRVAVFEGTSSTDGNVSSIVEQVELQAKRASKEYSTHLLVFPELFLSGYILNRDIMLSAARYIVENGVIGRLQQVARQYSIALQIGYPELDNDEKIYNTAILIDEDGKILLNYRKTHLWSSKEREVFEEGNELSSVVELRGVRVGIMICYDSEMCEVARSLSLRGAQLLIISTALSSSPRNKNIACHMIPTRALENHVWIAYANLALPDFYGLSRIIGPDGDELCRVENDPLIVADLIPKNYLSSIASTPYLADRRPLLYTAIHDMNYHVQLPANYQYTDD